QVGHGVPPDVLLEEGQLGAPASTEPRPGQLQERMAHGPPDPPCHAKRAASLDAPRRGRDRRDLCGKPRPGGPKRKSGRGTTKASGRSRRAGRPSSRLRAPALHIARDDEPPTGRVRAVTFTRTRPRATSRSSVASTARSTTSASSTFRAPGRALVPL